jgi:hypothetical protein
MLETASGEEIKGACRDYFDRKSGSKKIILS